MNNPFRIASASAIPLLLMIYVLNIHVVYSADGDAQSKKKLEIAEKKERIANIKKIQKSLRAAKGDASKIEEVVNEAIEIGPHTTRSLTKTLEQEGRFTAERLRLIHRKLLEADLAIKTGAADEQMALDMLVVEISVSAGARQ